MSKNENDSVLKAGIGYTIGNYLVKGLENNVINTIIVKDLSRFGRNYIEVGNYLEQIFPVNNIRFIIRYTILNQVFIDDKCHKKSLIILIF